MWNSLIFDSVSRFRFRFRIPDSGFQFLVLPPIVLNKAGVEHAGVKGGKFIVVNHVSETKETTTYEPAESLLFNDSNNQFSLTGSPENFVSFMLGKLGFSSVLDQQRNMHSVENCKRDFQPILYINLRPYWFREKRYMYNLQETRFARFEKKLYNFT